MIAREFAAGAALYGPVEIHDRATTATLAGFRRQLHDGTAAAIRAAARAAADRPKELTTR